MSRFLLAILTLAATFVALAGDVQAQASYRLKSGDVLQLEVVEDPGLNRSMLVLPDGTVTVPQVGSVEAAGNTIDALQGTITDRLTPNFANPPTVYLSIGQLAQRGTGGGSGTRAARTMPVYAIGEIAKPGKIEVAQGTTLLQFLAEAGGLTKFAAPKRIQLRRTDAAGRQKVYRFDYNAVLSGAGGTSWVLQSGDVVVVPQRRLFE